MDYFIHLAILCCIYLMLAQALNLTFGLGGLFNLAHVASYAIGAYTTALGTVDLHLGFFSCIVASMATSGLFAVLLGAISLKLSRDYFAIGTLAFSSVVSAVLVNWKSLTRGVLGIPGIPRPEFPALDTYDNLNFLILISGVTLLVFVIFYFIFRSPFARVLRGQAESPLVMETLGSDVALNNNMAFLISSAVAGLSGSFFAYYLNYIDPSSFSFSEMALLLTIVVLGAPGSFWGVTAACIFLVLLPEPLRFSNMLPWPLDELLSRPGVLGPMRQFIYALILFAVVFIKRNKLFPERRVV